jgi:hypothetical protein
MKQDENKKEKKVVASGSLAIALFFLAFFIMMYAINYHLLSQSWGVR